MTIEIRADFRRRGFCLFVRNVEAIGPVFMRYKAALLTRDWLLREIS